MFENHPFRVEVYAVITRADGTEESLGIISSNVIKEECEHSTDFQDQK